MKVLTVGTFDILHRGHIELFRKCKDFAFSGVMSYPSENEFVVGLNSDEFIVKYKGKPPIMDYKERKKAIESLGFCDVVIGNNQDDGSIKDLIEFQGTEVVVIGTDWHRKDYLAQIGLTEEYLEEKGISLIYVPYTQGISTTEIKRRISEN